jgi:hypothetical protein
LISACRISAACSWSTQKTIVFLAALHHLAGLDLVAGVAEGGEDPVLRLIDEDIAVREVENSRPAVLARPVPAPVP